MDGDVRALCVAMTSANMIISCTSKYLYMNTFLNIKGRFKTRGSIQECSQILKHRVVICPLFKVTQNCCVVSYLRSKFSPFLWFFLVCQNYQNTVYLLNIKFIFGRCLHSFADGHFCKIENFLNVEIKFHWNLFLRLQLTISHPWFS